MLGVILTLLVVLATLGIAFSDGTGNQDSKAKSHAVVQSAKKLNPRR